MATELSRFIYDFLKEHPEHADREFLKAKEAETAEYLLARDPEIANQAVETARRKIQELVDSGIERRGVLADSVMSDNERKRKRGNDRHGAEYVGNLLPPNCRQFAHIINNLQREHINTKGDLIKVFDISRLRNVGDFRAKFIVAMQDLAIAEKSQVPQMQ